LAVVTFLVRLAVAAEMDDLRDLYRRSSLSNDGDRVNLLAHSDALDRVVETRFGPASRMRLDVRS
jgi:hypothetical protein